MAGINYFALEEKIREVFSEDPSLNGYDIKVEGELDFEAGMAPWIGIYLDRRDPAPGQPLASGGIVRYRLRFTIWCWAMSLESTQDAMKQRDDMVSKVELVCLKNLTFGDTFDMSWLMGGEMPSGRLEAPDSRAVYLSGAEIILVAELNAEL